MSVRVSSSSDNIGERGRLRLSSQADSPACSLHCVYPLLRSLCSLPSVFCELPAPRSLPSDVSSAQLRGYVPHTPFRTAVCPRKENKTDART